MLKRILRGGFPLAVLVLCGGRATGQIADVVSGVRADSIRVTVERLVAFDTRFMGSDSNRASALYLQERMRAFGYETALEPFSLNVNRTVFGQHFVLSGLEQVNVIARKPGVLHPDRKIIIGGHYDSIALDRAQVDQDLAPGADDNASGISAVVEIARLLSNVDLDVTVEFAFWGAEELGLVGSRAYAAAARDRDDEIVLMIQLDAIGDPGTLFPDTFSIDTTSPNASIAQHIVDASLAYSTLHTEDGFGRALRITSRGCQCSDHQSFLDLGFPAVGIFQFYDNPAPHLNMSTDTLDKVNVAYVAEVTKAALGGLLDLADFEERSADFDRNGIVDFADFLGFAAHFGETVLGMETAVFDLDRDGSVGFSDFLKLAEQYGQPVSG